MGRGWENKTFEDLLFFYLKNEMTVLLYQSTNCY